MKQNEITKSFVIISNLKKPFGPHDFYKNISALEGGLICFDKCCVKNLCLSDNKQSLVGLSTVT